MLRWLLRIINCLALTIIISLLLDMVLPGQAMGPPHVVARLTTDDPRVIKIIKDELYEDSGYKIVFIGDSLIYSSASKLDRETLASYFSRFIHEAYPDLSISIYDLSMPGGSFVTGYELLKYIFPAQPDLIIIDINMVWFGLSKVEHEVVKNLNLPQDLPGLKPAKLGVFPDELYLPWYEKDFSYLKESSGELGVFTADRNNIQWAAFEDTVQLLKQSQVKGVFYLPPRNRELYAQYHLIDEEALAQKNELMRAMVQGPGMYLFDYTWRINSDDFSDLVHTLPEGSKEVARLLAMDMADNKVIR